MTPSQRAEKAILAENARLRGIMVKERRDVLKALEESGPMTPGELRGRLGWIGYRVRDALNSADRIGLVARDDSGRYCLTGR